MPRYVIHVGPPKTATTYLQRCFTRLAPALAASGVLYPLDLGTPGHVDIARALADDDADGTLHARFQALNAAREPNVLLSAEDLASQRRPRIEQLHRLLDGNPATIVYTCRSWIDLVRSRWGERVKHGAQDTLQETCAAAFEQPLRTSAVNYDLTLRRWTRIFGPPSLRMVSLQGVGDAGLDVADHFLRSFLDVAIDIPRAEQVENRSFPLADTEILRALNAIHHERTGLRSSAIRQAFIRYREDLELDPALAAIEADRVTLVFDETRPRLLKIHRQLFATYGDRLVPPHEPGMFFRPRRAQVAAIGGHWLHEPPVRAALDESYGRLTRAMAARRRRA